MAGRPLRWFALFAMLLTIAGLAWLVGPYWRLSGQFGQISLPSPSRLYGRSLDLERGDFVSVDDVEHYLVTLGYRRTEATPVQGSYRRTESPPSIETFLRPFPTLQGLSPAQHLSIRWTGRRVGTLELAARAMEHVVLEPPILAAFYGDRLTERRPVALESLPRDLVLAVLAAEDAAFYEHAGISVSGIFRALWTNVRRGEVVQGGSTLTQQLVKNIYLTHERTFVRKVREAVLSIFLEMRFEKERLLETYLNEIFWGRDGPVQLLGLGAAARAYYAKEASELDLNEAAVLAGIIQSPGNLDPRTNPDGARERRDFVLQRMVNLDWLEPERAERLLARELPSTVRPRRPEHRGYLHDAVAREARERFGIEQLGDAGYDLLSTLDVDDQDAAVEAVRQGLGELEKQDEGAAGLQAAFLSIDPRTGEVRAYVGGRDYGESQFDRVSQSQRQPGSAFKPVVFATAFARGVATPATLLDDSPLTLRVGARTWSPKNVDRRFRGPISARRALEQSVNVPTVRLGELVGWEPVVATARRLGVVSRLQPLPSLALGAYEVSPWELLTVYGTFANGGYRPELHLLRGALDRHGRRLDGEPIEPPRAAIDEGTAFLVNHLLQGAVERGTGSGVRTRGIYEPLAGKTGTTNGGRDNWFVGYAPNRASLVWVGHDDNRRTKLHGSSAALPIWARFAVDRRPPEGYGAFEAPPGVRFVPVDRESGQRAGARCGRVMTEAFLDGSLPLSCSLHAPGAPHRDRELARQRREKSRRPDDESWIDRIFGRRRD